MLNTGSYTFSTLEGGARYVVTIQYVRVRNPIEQKRYVRQIATIITTEKSTTEGE